MATRNIVPRADNEGQLGRSDKKWNKVIATDGDFSTLVLPGGEVFPVDDNSTDAAHTWSAAKISTLEVGGGGSGIGGITTDWKYIEIASTTGQALDSGSLTTSQTLSYDLSDWTGNTNFDISKVRGVYIRSRAGGNNVGSVASINITAQSQTESLFVLVDWQVTGGADSDDRVLFVPLNENDTTFDLVYSIDQGGGAVSAQTWIIGVQQITHEAEIATSDTQYVAITGTNGTPALSQIATSTQTRDTTYTYTISDFIGTNFRPDDVRGIYVACVVELQSTNYWVNGIIYVTMPDGTEKAALRGICGGGTWESESEIIFIPINNGQTEVDIRLYKDASSSGETTNVSFQIIGVEQANLQLIDASTLSMAGKIGEIIAWPGDTAPADFLECGGQEISRPKSAGGTEDTYLELWNIIGTRYGVGDGSTTFNVPNYRGQFLRGFDNGEGIDPDAAFRTDSGDGTTGDNVGTKQSHALDDHNHTSTANMFGITNVDDVSLTAGNDKLQTLENWITGTTGTNVSTETRPTNVSVMWCIRYIGAPANQSSKTLTVADHRYVDFTGTTDNGGSLDYTFGASGDTITFQLGNFSGEGYNYQDVRGVYVRVNTQSNDGEITYISYKNPNGEFVMLSSHAWVGFTDSHVCIPVNPGQTEISFQYYESNAAHTGNISILGADQIFYEDGTVVYAGSQGSEYWEHQATLPSAGSSTVVPHTLSRKPTLVKAVAVAKTTGTPTGFIAGREYDVTIMEAGGGNVVALQLGYDSSNIYVQVAANGAFMVTNSSGTVTIASAANFDIKYKAWTQIPISSEIEIYESPDVTIAANTLSFPHGLSQKPTNLEMYLICTDVFGNLGYVQGDVVSHQSHTNITLGSDNTNVYVNMATGVNPSIVPKTGGVATAINNTSWKIRVKAIKDGSSKSNLPYNYLAGYKLTCPGASSTFTIGKGQCMDSTNSAELKLDSSMQKNITLAWSAGDGGGAKPAGVSTGTDVWLHVFVFKDIFGNIDVAVDDNINATHIVNLLNGVYFRRICSIQCANATTLKGIVQDGDEFWFMDSVLSDTGTTISSNTLVTMDVPTGFKTTAIWSGGAENSTGANLYLKMYDPDTGVVTAPDRFNNHSHYYSNTTRNFAQQVRVTTDTSSRLRLIVNGSAMNEYSFYTDGWVDIRNKNN